MVYLGIIAAIGITIFYYWRTMPEISRFRRYLLAILRIIALSIVMILLFNPIIRYNRKLERKPHQLLLLDNSVSMQETSDDGSKFDQFQNSAQKINKILIDKGYSVSLISFANGIDGDKSSSRLAATISEMREDDKLRNTEEIFLFSDGWFDDSDPEFIQNIQLPVNVQYHNFTASGFDLEVVRLKYNQRAWLK